MKLHTSTDYSTTHRQKSHNLNYIKIKPHKHVYFFVYISLRRRHVKYSMLLEVREQTIIYRVPVIEL